MSIDEEYKKYQQKKLEYLKNKKHERYFPVPTGDGYLIIDKLADREGYGEKGYNLRCGFTGEPVKDDRYKSVDEFIDLLNNLDVKVNGELYDKDMVLFSKPKLYQLLESKIDPLLSEDLIYPKNIEVILRTGTCYDDLENIHILCTIFKSSGQGHPLLDNQHFMRCMEIINARLDELEKQPESQENNVRIDELLTIKKYLLDIGRMMAL